MEQIRLGLRVYIIHLAASAAKLLQRAAENFCAGSQVAPWGEIGAELLFLLFLDSHARSGGAFL